MVPEKGWLLNFILSFDTYTLYFWNYDNKNNEFVQNYYLLKLKQLNLQKTTRDAARSDK